MSQKIHLNETWTEIVSGPFSETLFIEAGPNAALYQIATIEPTPGSFGLIASYGDRIGVVLDENEKIYARSISGNSSIWVTQQDAVISVQPYVEAEVSVGKVFYIFHEYTGVQTGQTVYLSFSTGASLVTAISREIKSNGDNTVYKVYSGSVFSEQDLLTPRNYNSRRPGTTVVSASYNPIVSDPGSVIDYIPIFGSVGAGNRTSGFSDVEGIGRPLPKNSDFLLSFTNRSKTSEADIYYRLTWVEAQNA